MHGKASLQQVLVKKYPRMLVEETLKKLVLVNSLPKIDYIHKAAFNPMMTAANFLLALGWHLNMLHCAGNDISILEFPKRTNKSWPQTAANDRQSSGYTYTYNKVGSPFGVIT